MAPPGVNLFYDHVDTGSYYGKFFLKTSLLDSVVSPSTKHTFISAPRRMESDILSILSDHDYVSKPAECDVSFTEESKNEEDGTESCTEDSPVPGDAMLSSAADFSNETVTDTDFLEELDSLDFTDLDPCSDVAMEDGFQDFIDSVLEKSEHQFYGNDLDNDSARCDDHKAVIFNKEDFLSLLGLQSCKLADTPGVESIPLTSHSFVPVVASVVPTRNSSSCSEIQSRVVYSMAASHECTSVPAVLHDNKSRSHYPQSTIVVLSLDHMTPLTVDTSFEYAHELSTPCLYDTNEVYMEDDVKPQCIEDDTTKDLLKWLNGDQTCNNDSGSVSYSTEPITNLQCDVPQLSYDSFVDLGEFVCDSSCFDQNKTSDLNKNNHLKLSFLSSNWHRLESTPASKKSLLETPHSLFQTMLQSPDSQMSEHSWASSPASSPSMLDNSSVESTQLELLNLFSEENAPALHSLEDSELRYI